MLTNIESVFKCVNRFVVQFSFRWALYCQLFDSGPDNIALLNASGAEVFSLCQKLMVDDAIMALSRLTDPPSSGKERDNASIPHLLNLAAPHLDKSTNDELQATLVQLRKLLQNALAHRSKALAHADLRHAVQTKALPPVRYDELEGAMEECRRIMRKLSKSLFGRTCSHEVIIPFDRGGSALLAKLRKASAMT